MIRPAKARRRTVRQEPPASRGQIKSFIAQNKNMFNLNLSLCEPTQSLIILQVLKCCSSGLKTSRRILAQVGGTEADFQQNLSES